jgi:hypothetical protein
MAAAASFERYEPAFRVLLDSFKLREHGFSP